MRTRSACGALTALCIPQSMQSRAHVCLSGSSTLVLNLAWNHFTVQACHKASTTVRALPLLVHTALTMRDRVVVLYPAQYVL